MTSTATRRRVKWTNRKGIHTASLGTHHLAVGHGVACELDHLVGTNAITAHELGLDAQ